MLRERRWRTRLLAATCAGVLATVACSLFIPSAGYRSLSTYNFPETAPLEGWDLIETNPLHDQRKIGARDADVVQSGRRYRYLQRGISVDAEIRYVEGRQGDVGKMYLDQTAIPQAAFERRELRGDASNGIYALFAHDQRAHLTACLSRRGGSTATSEQFRENHRTHDFTLNRIAPWIMGRESLRDFRCFWVSLSTPAPGDNPDVAYPHLESAWKELHRWWQPRFPDY